VNIVVVKNRGSGFADRGHVARRWGLLALLMLPVAAIAGCGGCTDSSTSVFHGDPGGTAMAEHAPRGLLEIAIGNLNRQEEFPSGEMLQQIVDQLNQWIRAQKPSDDWKPDPLVGTLPAPLAEMPSVRGLGELRFPRSDGMALQEAIWLRNVARWARGDQLDDISRARRLFDWTVRNIQLEGTPDPQSGERLGQLPWETLLLGQGTAVERAWVFILLARQQGLEAALLALPDRIDPAQRPPRPWAVGVLVRGEVYLFDPALGLPLPAPDGVRLDEAGPLDIRPATLAQVATDDSLLRRLDLDRDRPYPLESSGLDRVIALIEASPAYLARRMKLVESRLLGGRRVVLSTSATAQAQRWKATPRITDAQLWMFPYQVLWQRQNATETQSRQRFMDFLPFYATYAAPTWNSSPAQPTGKEIDPFYQPRRTTSQKGVKDAPLRKGRILYFKGELTGPQGATQAYQQARPPDERLAGLAEYYYQTGLKDLQSLPPEQTESRERELKRLSEQRARVDGPLLRRAKQDASYWLGLMNLDLGQIELRRNHRDDALKHYHVAIDYLLTRTLEASPDGPWTPGANYNLGRCYEAIRQYDEAITRYTADLTSPGYHGNLLRARWLNKLRAATEQGPPKAREPKGG
jgi:tetratricopeptide (TPR) repeat protein